MSKIPSPTAKVVKKSRKSNSARGSKPGEKRGGRKAGVPNKVTTDARSAIAKFVDANSDRMQEWLEAVAVESPEKAFYMLRDLIEYHVPKLSRAEVTGKDGADLIPRAIHVHFLAART